MVERESPFARLDHVIIAVHDLDAAEATTSRLLGRRASWHGGHPGAGTANVLYRVDRTYLELLAPAPTASGGGPLGEALAAHLARHGEGLFGLALGTADADAAAAWLRAQGLAPTRPADGAGRDIRTGAHRTWRNFMLPRRDTRGVFLLGIEHKSPAEALPVAGAEHPEPSTLVGIDHIVVRSQDPDQSVALWGSRLGVRLALDRRFEAFGTRLVFFRLGGVTVEIAAPLDATPAEGEEARDLLYGLSWKTNDVAAAHARLTDTGFDVSPMRTGRRAGTSVFTVRAGTLGVPTLVLGPGA